MKFAVAVVALVAGTSAALAQQSPFLANIDPFTSGPLNVNVSLSYQGTQLNLPDVVSNRRQSTFASVILTPGVSNNVTINTSGAGTLSVNHITSATTGQRGVYIFNYGGPTSTIPLGSPLTNFNFPGIHGVAFDFNSLSANLPYEVSLTSSVGGGTVGWRTNGTVPAGSTPFRFRTTWQDYVGYGGASGFDLSSVSSVTISFTANPGTTFSIDGFGIAPTPGAAAGLLLGGIVTMRRRR